VARWGITAPDELGREVELTEERWLHIVDGHPELAPLRGTVIRAACAPTRRLPGRRPGEEWCYLEGVGPSKWLKVVVAYAGQTGRIVTAFPRRSLP
jgi:hypothetical protein